MQGWETYSGQGEAVKRYRRYEGVGVAQVISDEAAGQYLWRAYNGCRMTRAALAWSGASTLGVAITLARQKLAAIAARGAELAAAKTESEVQCSEGVGADGEILHRKGCAPRALAAFERRPYADVCADLQRIAREQGRPTDFQRRGTMTKTLRAYAKERGLRCIDVREGLKRAMKIWPNSCLCTPRHAIGVVDGKQAVYKGARGYRRGSIDMVITGRTNPVDHG